MDIWMNLLINKASLAVFNPVFLNFLNHRNMDIP